MTIKPGGGASKVCIILKDFLLCVCGGVLVSFFTYLVGHFEKDVCRTADGHLWAPRTFLFSTQMTTAALLDSLWASRTTRSFLEEITQVQL